MTKSKILDRDEVIDILGLEVVEMAEKVKPLRRSHYNAAENSEYDYYSAEHRIENKVVIVFYKTNPPQEDIASDEHWTDKFDFILTHYQIVEL